MTSNYIVTIEDVHYQYNKEEMIIEQQLLKLIRSNIEGGNSKKRMTTSIKAKRK